MRGIYFVHRGFGYTEDDAVAAREYAEDGCATFVGISAERRDAIIWLGREYAEYLRTAARRAQVLPPPSRPRAMRARRAPRRRRSVHRTRRASARSSTSDGSSGPSRHARSRAAVSS